MKTIELKKVGPANLKGSTENFKYNLKIDYDCRIIDKESGKFILRYIKNNCYSLDYFSLLKKLKINKSDRTSGISCHSLIFGFAPRDPLKNLPARAVKTEKNTNFVWMNLLKYAVGKFKELEKELFEAQIKKVGGLISKNWVLPGGVFTSGIINKSNQLVFHTDNGNVKDCLSLMFCFKKSIDGGSLILPEYDAAIDIADKSILIFDGQSVSHGVEHFRKMNKDSDRFTIVFYALEKLSKAKDGVKEEIEEFNRKENRKLKSEKS